MSTTCYVKPNVATKFFKNNIKNGPFQINTAHGSSRQEYSILLSVSKIFNLAQSPKLIYFLFDFHNDFDSFLGMDHIKFLKAIILMKVIQLRNFQKLS